MEKKIKNKLFEVSLKLILKNDKGQTLILKAIKDSSIEGYYDFPGGRIAEGEETEPFEKLTEREVKEELGSAIKLSVIQRPVALARHVYISKKDGSQRYILWVFFEAKYLGGEIKISEEHNGYEWVELEKIRLVDYFIKGPLEGVKTYLKWKK